MYSNTFSFDSLDIPAWHAPPEVASSAGTPALIKANTHQYALLPRMPGCILGLRAAWMASALVSTQHRSSCALGQESTCDEWCRSDASSPWGSPSESDDEPSFRVSPARRSLSNYAKEQLQAQPSDKGNFMSCMHVSSSPLPLPIPLPLPPFTSHAGNCRMRLTASMQDMVQLCCSQSCGPQPCRSTGLRLGLELLQYALICSRPTEY